MQTSIFLTQRIANHVFSAAAESLNKGIDCISSVVTEPSILDYQLIYFFFPLTI